VDIHTHKGRMVVAAAGGQQRLPTGGSGRTTATSAAGRRWPPSNQQQVRACVIVGDEANQDGACRELPMELSSLHVCCEHSSRH
jgi:hypothetical protein